MKTVKIDSKNDLLFAHYPANNDEYHVLIAALESCGLKKNENSMCDESWSAWRYVKDGTKIIELHTIWFDYI